MGGKMIYIIKETYEEKVKGVEISCQDIHKFANIKHKKEKNDAAKGKIFTIIGREIAVAVKEGGAGSGEQQQASRL